jgi:hypothetical protein
MDNEKAIEELVFNHFSLKPSSNFRFSQAIRNRFIDEEYKHYLDGNNRLIVEVPEEYYEIFDKGWERFKEVLPFFAREYGITYEDFRRNKIIHNKNTLKIIKLLKNYFFKEGELSEDKHSEYFHFLRNVRFLFPDSETLFEMYDDRFSKRFAQEIITFFINKLNEVRLSSDKKIYIVISFNYTDIFLSSTAEEWSSCLNLESRSFAAYWSCLPGAAIDRNLAVLYITNGSEKYYEGIVAPKMISRSFLLLDKEGVLNIVKFYPNELININIINEVLPFNIREIGPHYESKYEIEPLYYKNGYGLYFYQDKTRPIMVEGDKFFLKYGGKGLYTIKDGGYFEGPIFNWTGGFKVLKENNERILNFFLPPTKCETCGVLLARPRAFDFRGDYYCEEHYQNMIEEHDSFGNNLIECEHCGVPIHINDAIDAGMEYLCEDCYNEL